MFFNLPQTLLPRELIETTLITLFPEHDIIDEPRDEQQEFLEDFTPITQKKVLESSRKN